MTKEHIRNRQLTGLLAVGNPWNHRLIRRLLAIFVKISPVIVVLAFFSIYQKHNFSECLVLPTLCMVSRKLLRIRRVGSG